MIESVLDEALAPNTEKNRKFMDGDHWQGGDGWKGPRPDPADPEASEVLMRIESTFCSSNTIKEVVERHAGGALGREPVWGFTPRRGLKAGEKPTEEEQGLIDEIEAFITAWWNEKGAHGAFLEALQHALWAARGMVRCFVPSGRLTTWTVTGQDSQGQPVQVPRAGLKLIRGDIEGALHNLFIEAPGPEDSTVYTDPATQAKVGITRYFVKADENDPTSDDVEFFELVWVDDVSGRTFFRTVSVEDGSDSTIDLDMGGNRTLMMIERAQMITDQVVQNQMAMNVAITLSPENLADATYLERTFLNARMPGYEEEYEDPVTHQKRKRWVRENYVTGPGAVNFVKGEEIPQADGTTTLTTPQLVHKPASNLAPIFEGADFHYTLILKETHQTHILKNEEGRASGKSHEQARVDYNISLNDSKEPSEEVGRQALEAIVAWSEVLAGVPGKYSKVLRAFFECQLDLGPVSQDERSQNRQDVEAGLMDDETAMARAGILDVDKTKAIIATRPDAQLKQMERLAGISQKLGNKVPLHILAEMARFPSDVVAGIKKAEEEEQKRQEKVAKDQADAARRNQPPPVRRVPTGGSNAAA